MAYTVKIDDDLDYYGGGSVSVALNDITDVTITSVTDNEILVYDSGSSEWINQTISEAGLQSALSNPTKITGASLDGDDGKDGRTYTIADVWLVFVDGIYLHKGKDYTYSGGVITFTNPIWDTQNIGIVTK
jgi:hypothetical protein